MIEEGFWCYFISFMEITSMYSTPKYGCIALVLKQQVMFSFLVK